MKKLVMSWMIAKTKIPQSQNFKISNQVMNGRIEEIIHLKISNHKFPHEYFDH